MKTIAYLIGGYLLYEYLRTGQFALPSFAAPVATPGTTLPIYGGLSITVPGGTTYHLPNGDYVTIAGFSQGAPNGWVQGQLGSTGQLVFFNTITGQIQ